MATLSIYQDASHTPEARAQDLLARLSLEEKIGQLIEERGWLVYAYEDGRLTISDEFREKLAGRGLGALCAFFRADWWTGRNWDTGLPRSAWPKPPTWCSSTCERTPVGAFRSSSPKSARTD